MLSPITVTTKLANLLEGSFLFPERLDLTMESRWPQTWASPASTSTVLGFGQEKPLSTTPPPPKLVKKQNKIKHNPNLKQTGLLNVVAHVYIHRNPALKKKKKRKFQQDFSTDVVPRKLPPGHSY